MEDLQKLIEKILKQVPRFALEKRLSEKMREAGVPIDEATLSKTAEHILSGRDGPFAMGGDDDVAIQITDEDIDYVVKVSERFYNEQLAGVLDNVGDTQRIFCPSASVRNGQRNSRRIRPIWRR
jgi:hypothetical protein